MLDCSRYSPPRRRFVPRRGRPFVGTLRPRSPFAAGSKRAGRPTLVDVWTADEGAAAAFLREVDGRAEDLRRARIEIALQRVRSAEELAEAGIPRLVDWRRPSAG